MGLGELFDRRAAARPDHSPRVMGAHVVALVAMLPDATAAAVVLAVVLGLAGWLAVRPRDTVALHPIADGGEEGDRQAEPTNVRAPHHQEVDPDNEDHG